MKFRVSFVLISFLLSACTPMVWNKPGASQDDFSKDRYECLQQSQQRSAGASINRAGLVASDNVITNAELFRACMNAHGWYLQAQQNAVQQSSGQVKTTPQAPAPKVGKGAACKGSADCEGNMLCMAARCVVTGKTPAGEACWVPSECQGDLTCISGRCGK